MNKRTHVVLSEQLVKDIDDLVGGRPLVLTVKGKAEAVVMAPAVYRKLADYHDAVEGIRRGLVHAKKGLGRSVDEVFDAIEKDTA